MPNQSHAVLLTCTLNMSCNISKLLSKFPFNPVIREHDSNRVLQKFVYILSLLFNSILCIALLAFNIIALLFFYFYLKNFKKQTAFLFGGYVAIFKTFAEFISATVCFTYGLIDMKIFYLIGGAIGIFLGLMVRVIFYFNQREQCNDDFKSFTIMFTGFYIFVVYLCSCAFYYVALNAGVVDCASRIITCVFPMMALSESLEYRVMDSFLLSTMVDVIAVTIMCLYCAQVSVKYFFLLPNLVGLLLVAIESISVMLTKLVEDYRAEDSVSENEPETEAEAEAEVQS